MPDGSMVPFTGPAGIGNEFVTMLLNDERFAKGLMNKFGSEFLSKADTISQATNLLWYDLSPLIHMLYPYRELIPRVSRLPRVPADGGNAFRWKRIVGINTTGISSGVSEGNRGARIALSEQDMMAAFKTLGLEASVTFEARLGAKNLTPEALGISVQSNLRSLMIDEEKILINGNASQAVGTTPTPTLIHGTVAGLTGAWSGAPIFVCCVGLTGFGNLNYSPFNSGTGLGGVPSQITKANADGSSDVFGAGSARPSAIATVTPLAAELVTASVAVIPGILAYAWYVGLANTPANMYLAGVTPSNQVILTRVPPSTNQPLSSVYVAGNPIDNSVNSLIPDGILPQIFGAVMGGDPGRSMATSPVIPSGISFSPGGSILYNMGAGNTGLTLSGSTIPQFDAVIQAAYDQYKISFDRILMSSVDMLNSFGVMLNQGSNANIFRLLFDADQETGRIVAGRKVTSYMNKMFNNTLDVEVHPYVPPGTIIFWSDRSPYELSGVANLLEARVRQDYYQIQWPWRARRYEYGVYVDEVFACYFTPAFAIITNLNPSTGTFVF